MEKWIIGVAIAVGSPILVSLGVAAFAKFLPKQQTLDKVFAPCAEKCAVVVYTFMGTVLRLRKSEKDKIEEGLFKTLAFWLDGWIHIFSSKLDALIDEEK